MADGRGPANTGPLPWASVFDPAANARAFADIQGRGLRAAADLVDRLVASLDAAASGAAKPGDDGVDPPIDPVQGWIELLRRVAEGVGTFGRGEAAGPGGDARVDVVEGSTSGSLRVEPGASAEVWLHNGGPDATGAVRLHAGELRAHDGGTIAGEHVRFDPETVDELPGRSSRGVVVTVDPPPGTPAGTYRGMVLAAGLPDAWVPLEVVVP